MCEHYKTTTTACYPLAVTGSIASGKSFVSRQLVELGRYYNLPVTFVSVDKLRAAILEDSGPASHKKVQRYLIDYFGEEIVDRHGMVNRRRLADVVYWDRSAMEFQESLIDPIIIRSILQKRCQTSGILLIEWALFVEKKLLELSDYNVLLVSCSKECQLNRLRGGDLPVDQCQRRIELQLAPEVRRETVLEMQQQAGSGDFYEIDTETTPENEDYIRLLFSILNNCERGLYA